MIRLSDDRQTRASDSPTAAADSTEVMTVATG